jgi:glycogen operon protein
MLNQGDEFGRTQQGNNNAWNQDSALSWQPWVASPLSVRMLAFTRRVLALRRRYQVFRRTEFLPDHESEGAVAHWLHLSGAVMSPAHWDDRERHALAVLLQTSVDGAEEAPPVRLLLAVNGGSLAINQQVPPGEWRLLLDTSRPGSEGESVAGAVSVAGGTLVLLEADATSTPRAP